MDAIRQAGDVIDLLLSWGTTTAAIFVVLGWDERRMTSRMRERAWPVASRRIAAVYFGPICLAIHFTRTRRTLMGFLMGIATMIGVTAFASLITAGIEMALGL